MKKLYTELQYKEYSELMERMANIDSSIEGFYIHEEINEWLRNNNINKDAEYQMTSRIEQEFNNEVKKEVKVIDFPKQE